MRKVFLDTNVFLYAAGTAHPHRSACRRVLEGVAAGEIEATTSAEVVQEILHVLARRGRAEDAVRLARNVLALFPNLLAIEAADLTAATDLLERYESLPARDALHASVVARHGLAGIVSIDPHFDRVDQIRRLAPETVAGPEGPIPPG